VEVLAPHIITWTLTVGDAIVGAGTLLLALFTWRLARVTVGLDERNVARQRKRDERRVRGIARLVDGELSVVLGTLRLANDEKAWRPFWPTPHGAWDRDGAVVAETLPQDEAEAIILFVSKLVVWEELTGAARAVDPKLSLTLDQAEQVAVAELLALHADARRFLKPLAYPDARDLPPDPDTLRPYTRKRRWEWLRRA
jgi:hypothetical protein